MLHRRGDVCSRGDQSGDTFQGEMAMSSEYTIACYYYPGYHHDPRNDARHGPGWTEWDLVRRAQPRFETHAQPNVPLWGYQDEADPAVMVRKIHTAADHGIDAFIFDWYWYDGPFLEGAIDRGFLRARSNDRIKFGLMWANHDWLDIHPAKLHCSAPLVFPGKVSPSVFEKITDDVIQRYFSHPSYWKIDGMPYFSIYDMSKLVAGLGSLGAAARCPRTVSPQGPRRRPPGPAPYGRNPGPAATCG